MSPDAPITVTEAEQAPGAASIPPQSNAAVQRCCEARERSVRKSIAGKVSSYDTKQRASQAFFNAMPHLTDYDSIRDFIACIAHGMVIDAVPPMEGPKYLYAAQVAVGALRLKPKEAKQPKESNGSKKEKKHTPTPLSGSNQTVAG